MKDYKLLSESFNYYVHENFPEFEIIFASSMNMYIKLGENTKKLPKFFPCLVGILYTYNTNSFEIRQVDKHFILVDLMPKLKINYTLEIMEKIKNEEINHFFLRICNKIKQLQKEQKISYELYQICLKKNIEIYTNSLEYPESESPEKETKKEIKEEEEKLIKENIQNEKTKFQKFKQYLFNK